MLYEIVDEFTSADFKSRVNTLLADGWVLHGTPTFKKATWSPDGNEFLYERYVQALVKDEDAVVDPPIKFPGEIGRFPSEDAGEDLPPSCENCAMDVCDLNSRTICLERRDDGSTRFEFFVPKTS